MDRDYDGWDNDADAFEDDERDFEDVPEDYDDMFSDEMEHGPEDSLSDVEADAMTLRDAGYGTDEDYGYYGE
jgi:hypothetical protein